MPLQLEASQRKSGEAAQAKSRTLRAVKRQVFVPGTRLPVFASASALVMICTRSADRRARASRARAVGPHTTSGFATVPVAATTNPAGDRKSTRLNSSHGYISYAVFCLKKKNYYK